MSTSPTARWRPAVEPAPDPALKPGDRDGGDRPVARRPLRGGGRADDGLVELTERARSDCCGSVADCTARADPPPEGRARDAEADAVRALGSAARSARRWPSTRVPEGSSRSSQSNGRRPGPRADGGSDGHRVDRDPLAVLQPGRAPAGAGPVSAAVLGLLAIGEFERQLGWEGPAQYPWRSQAALALEQLGHRDRARALAVEELKLARAYGAPRPIGISLRASGRLAEAQGRIGLLQEAVEVLASSGADLEHARGPD